MQLTENLKNVQFIADTTLFDEYKDFVFNLERTIVLITDEMIETDNGSVDYFLSQLSLYIDSVSLSISEEVVESGFLTPYDIAYASLVQQIKMDIIKYASNYKKYMSCSGVLNYNLREDDTTICASRYTAIQVCTMFKRIIEFIVK